MKKEQFRQALSSRPYAIAFIFTCIVLVAILIFGAMKIRPSELQVPMKNTVFGITYTYREQWYNQLTFVGFAVLVVVLNTILSIKLFHLKGSGVGTAFQWLTVLVLVMSLVFFIAIFNVISIVQ